MKLGDCFSTLPISVSAASTLPRYRVLHKLGYGSFATVWLARDLLPPGCVVSCIVIGGPLNFLLSRFVALKITVADFPADNREVRILKLLADNNVVDIEGSRYILRLLDNFQIEGPNGTHEVLVTEVLASLSDLKRYPVYKKVRPNEIQT